jgi:small-conductance mechanosensitive channel
MAAAHPASLHLFGVTLVGVTAENGRKLAITLALIVAASLAAWLLNKLIAAVANRAGSRRISFWLRQAVSLFTGIVVVLGVLSVWFDDPTRLTTAVGLVTAGVAVALQRVITAMGGYFLILRGGVFNVGDRIVMGGVRGEVVALSFLQTTVMEMGESRLEQPDTPAVWVRSRQYTGRLVTVSNAVVFDQPVYNYTREFPFLFEEMSLPIRYEDDWAKAEAILKAAAERHTVHYREMEEAAIKELRRRYFLGEENPGPRVYWRLTDNWLEMTIRFVVRDHGVRAVKDAMSREIIARLKDAGIGVASATYEIVGAPELKLRLKSDPPPA